MRDFKDFIMALIHLNFMVNLEKEIGYKRTNLLYKITRRFKPYSEIYYQKFNNAGHIVGFKIHKNAFKKDSE